MNEQGFCELINRAADARVRIEVQQKYLDELNKYGQIVSREEFLREVKKEHARSD